MATELPFLGEGAGTFILAKVGEDVQRGDALYLNDDGFWKKANASDPEKMPVLGLAMDDIKIEIKDRILISGIFGSENWSWSKGYILYQGIKDGQLTTVKPDYNVHVVQVVGATLNDKRFIFFSPHDISEVGAGVISSPPQGANYLPVSNIYVELVDGNPKLKIEYNE